MEYPKFKVCCQCFTFNQAKYIIDTMKGFIIQHTDFPFVCCIVDDASTDGEQDVIRTYVEEHFDMSKDGVAYEKETEYANIIYAQHKTNANCYFAVLFLKENHYSQRKPKMGYLSEWEKDVKYIAYCEGDDYWIHPKKLQMQVDWLEAHEDCGIVYAKSEVYNQKQQMFHKCPVILEYHSEKDIVSYGNSIPTASVMIKFDIVKQYRKNNFPKWPMGDCPLWIYASHVSKIKFLNENVCVYRVLEHSASCRDDFDKMCRFILSSMNMFLYFDDLYNLGMKRKIEERTYYYLFKESYERMKFKEAADYYRHLSNKKWTMYVKYFICKMESIALYKLSKLFMSIVR